MFSGRVHVKSVTASWMPTSFSAPRSLSHPRLARPLGKTPSLLIPYAIRNIAAQEASRLSSSGQPYLDVRTKEEFSAGHAPNAVNVPLMNAVSGGGMAPNPDFVRTVEETFPDKQFEFIVACQAGKRSAMAVEALKNAGYENMCNFEGGFQAWYAEGLQVER